MAYPTAVNAQITDAVNQSNMRILDETPPIALGNFGKDMAHSMGVPQLYAMDTAQADAMAEASLESILKAIQSAAR